MITLDLVLSFIVGLAAGAVYFGALWLTVRWVTRGDLAPAWLLVSAAVRLAFLMGVLFWIMDGQIDRLAAALVGFLLVRLGAIWPLRRNRDVRARKSGPTIGTEVSDAADPR
jgi:F1F0 ATPase subunit 2